MLDKFVNAGLQVKILTGQSLNRILWILKSIGWGDEAGLNAISGSELGQLEPRQYPHRIQEAMVFSDLTPAQKSDIVQELQRQGEYVAMLGDKVSDVPAMRQAYFRLALRSSAQAALALTDVVLLKDSLEELPSILTTGQRMVNSVLDTFKLYLSPGHLSVDPDCNGALYRYQVIFLTIQPRVARSRLSQ